MLIEVQTKEKLEKLTIEELKIIEDIVYDYYHLVSRVRQYKELK